MLDIKLEFFKKKTVNDGDRTQACLVYFMVRKSDGARVGRCTLRPVYNEYTHWLGNIGYRVYPSYRGNSYAYQAVLLLFDIAREMQMDYVLITCDPDNFYSEKICRRLEGEYLGQFEVPDDFRKCPEREKSKLIFRYEL